MEAKAVASLFVYNKAKLKRLKKGSADSSKAIV